MPFNVSQEIADGRFKITAGISNLFDNKPPRTTTAVLNGGTVQTIGQSVFSSQYDMIGRRGFRGDGGFEARTGVRGNCKLHEQHPAQRDERCQDAVLATQLHG